MLLSVLTLQILTSIYSECKNVETKTCAIPDPIKPLPIIVTYFTEDVLAADELKLRDKMLK